MALKILAEAVEVIVINLIFGWFAAGCIDSAPYTARVASGLPF
jgi:hypothetical protein